MKLTKKKAKEICIELWTWLAETGRRKGRWPGWKKYGRMLANCPFCEYYVEQNNGGCPACPIALCRFDDSFSQWCDATTSAQRKKYAKIFLEKIRE